MANKNKQKGYYHERKIVEWLSKIGIKTKRQPLSGALGGEYRGDIKAELMGHELVGEIKYRDKSGFPSPCTVLDSRDFAIYKRRHGEPQTIVIFKGDIFEMLRENQHESERAETNTPEDR